MVLTTQRTILVKPVLRCKSNSDTAENKFKKLFVKKKIARRDLNKESTNNKPRMSFLKENLGVCTRKYLASILTLFSLRFTMSWPDLNRIHPGISYNMSGMYCTRKIMRRFTCTRLPKDMQLEEMAANFSSNLNLFSAYMQLAP